MKQKKITRYIILGFLTLGASLIIGFLSFGGVYVIIPVLSVAFSLFSLSVGYEAEIYWQNISKAWDKLFKPKYLQRQIARESLLTLLLDHFPKGTGTGDCPQFFTDYEKELRLHASFGNGRLDKKTRARKDFSEKHLKSMENWFAQQLFADNEGETIYEKNMRDWLKINSDMPQEKYKKREFAFGWLKTFSIVAALFMSLGTTYLLVEAFAVIPFFAVLPAIALPLLIVPMAIIAGVAYGLLTYNAVTDMLTNNTLQKWYHKLKKNLSEGPITPYKVVLTLAAVVLVTLAIGLTICTAGTWWTIVKTTPALFTWMAKMPHFIMGIINPIVTGLSSVIFNLQNSSETLGSFNKFLKKGISYFIEHRIVNPLKQKYQELCDTENIWQRSNPFRILIILTILPLRVLLFVGHLVSIGLTSDRIPGIPNWLSALAGTISEGAEDWHYFFGDEHEHNHTHHQHHHQHEPTLKHLLKDRLGQGHNHNHGLDIPTNVLKAAFSPLYTLAALWDWSTSQINDGVKREKLRFDSAFIKQWGLQKETTVDWQPDAQFPSNAWATTHALYRMERYKEKNLSENAKNQQENKILSAIQQQLRTIVPDQGDTDLKCSLHSAATKFLSQKQHGFFDKRKRNIQTFLTEKLPQRVFRPCPKQNLPPNVDVTAAPPLSTSRSLTAGSINLATALDLAVKPQPECFLAEETFAPSLGFC